MALLVSQVFLRVQDILTDQAGARWPEAELLRHLNDGRQAIATVRPDLYATITDVVLVAGVRQSLPSDGMRLIDILCNVSAAGAPVSPVRVTSKEVLDAQNPLWVVSTGGSVRNFMYDERYPRIFHVAPGAVAGAKLRVVYSKSPVEITVTTEELTHEGIYAPSLVDYVAYRCYMKNATWGANAQRAQTHYQMFMQALGAGGAAGVAVAPNVGNEGGNIPRTAAAAAA
jgi:hypothetical protein